MLAHMNAQRYAKRWAKAINEREVHVCIKLQSLDSISTVQHSFHADFTMILHWTLPEASYNGILAMEKLAALEGLDNFIAYWDSPNSFMPKVEFENAKEYTQIEADSDLRKYPRIDFEVEYTMKWTMRFVGTFRTTFDLGMFPFDSQQLAIKMRFRRQGKIARVRAVPSAYRESKLAVEDVEKSDMIVLKNVEMRGGEFGAATHFSVRVFVQRAWKRYLWNIVCINFALAVMGWCVLIFTPPTQTNVRHDAILNLLLTSVAFKFAVNDDLPKLPFLTALDWYVLLNFFFLFLHAIETWVVGSVAIQPQFGRDLVFSNKIFQIGLYPQTDKVSQRDWELKALEYEAWFIRGFGGIWCLIQIYVFRFGYVGLRNMHLQNVYSEAMGEVNKARAKRHGQSPVEKARAKVHRKMTMKHNEEVEQGVGALRRSKSMKTTEDAGADPPTDSAPSENNAESGVGTNTLLMSNPNHGRRMSYEMVGLPVCRLQTAHGSSLEMYVPSITHALSAGKRRAHSTKGG
jgi:hypothetical protein